MHMLPGFNTDYIQSTLSMPCIILVVTPYKAKDYDGKEKSFSHWLLCDTTKMIQGILKVD